MQRFQISSSTGLPSCSARMLRVQMSSSKRCRRFSARMLRVQTPSSTQLPVLFCQQLLYKFYAVRRIFGIPVCSDLLCEIRRYCGASDHNFLSFASCTTSCIRIIVVVISADSPIIAARSSIAADTIVSAGMSFPRSITRYP